MAKTVISSGLDKQQTTTEFNQPYDIIKGGTGSQKYQILNHKGGRKSLK